MAVQLNNIHFAPPSGFTSASGATHSSPKRKSFFDYFPNLKENYKGYIRQSIFKNKMDMAIRQAIESVNARYRELSPESNLTKIPSDLIVKSKFSIDQTGLDKRAKEREAESYYESIRADLLYRIWGEEWRTPSEMHLSEDMRAQSNNYFTTVGKDIAMIGAGKLVDKTFGIARQVGGKTISKAVASGQFSQKMGKIVGSAFTRNASKFMGEKVGTLETIDASIDTFTQSKKEKKYSTIDYSDMSDLNATLGNNLSEKELVVANTFATGLDMVTDFHPAFRVGKFIVKSGLNIALGVQTRATANRMKKTEDKSNAAERNFNQKLKQTIYNDVDALSFNDIKHLIEEVGLTKLTKYK